MLPHRDLLGAANTLASRLARVSKHGEHADTWASVIAATPGSPRCSQYTGIQAGSCMGISCACIGQVLVLPRKACHSQFQQVCAAGTASEAAVLISRCAHTAYAKCDSQYAVPRAGLVAVPPSRGMRGHSNGGQWASNGCAGDSSCCCIRRSCFVTSARWSARRVAQPSSWSPALATYETGRACAPAHVDSADTRTETTRHLSCRWTGKRVNSRSCSELRLHTLCPANQCDQARRVRRGLRTVRASG